MNTHPTIGIMGAMPEETEGILSLMNNIESEEIAGRVYYKGALFDQPVVLVFSRWGKVAAATTVTTLIQRYDIRELIFTGVAGAIHPQLRIGDIVIGRNFYQHDMDARPIMKQFEIPLLGKMYFEASYPDKEAVIEKIKHIAGSSFLRALIKKEIIERFGLHQPKVWYGDVASGDQFIAAENSKANLRHALPEVLCVEMEGAAVAQVCFEHSVPFIVLRVISDTAGDEAPVDFGAFINEVAGKYATAIVRAIMNKQS